MNKVNIFDIATRTWFSQYTTAEMNYPSDRSKFCSVVATAADNSSYNIYIYGGEPYAGGVFILTLPAFHWVQVYPSDMSTDTSHRAVEGHKCVKVHEKYMVAYRGYYASSKVKCDSSSESNRFQGMAIYDMSALKWTTKVGLENQQYMIPQALHEIIGGK